MITPDWLSSVLRIPGESQGPGPLRVTHGAALTLAALVVLSLSPVLLVLQGDATGQDGDQSPHSEAIKKLIGTDPGESIYNDRLKRFKFRLEKIPVRTAETAKAFWHMYSSGDSDDEASSKRPKLIGAWGDPLTNSIVIIGPPEAEQAIRETLAEWESAVVGVSDADDTLEIRRVYLQRERRGLLREIALLEVEIVSLNEITDRPAVRDEKLKLFTERVRSLEQELHVIDRKLEVIEKNIRRRDGPRTSQFNESGGGEPGTINQPPAKKPVPASAGAVVWRKNAIVWINRGTADRMRQGLQLNVTSSISGQAKRQLFGRIEITRLVGEHLSEARVLQEERGRPIAKGDQIAWLAEVRQIPLTLVPLEVGTVIQQDHIGMGPWQVGEIPGDARLSAHDFIGRVVLNRIDVVQPIREQDLCLRGELPPSTAISFHDLKLVDEEVPEPIRRLIGRHVTLKGLMYPHFTDTGIKRFVLAADRELTYFDRHPEPHELVSVELAPGLSTDAVDQAIRVFGVLRTETLDEADGGGLRFVLKTACISDVGPKSENEAAGISPPAAPGQQQSPQAVTQVGTNPESLPVPEQARQTEVQLQFSGPERATVPWPAGQDGGESDKRTYVLPATIPGTTGQTTEFPVSNLPGRDGLQLFASLEVASASQQTAVYLKHSAIPLTFSEEDIDQAVSGNLVTKAVYLPRPEFQEQAVAGVETLVTFRLDPDVDPIVEAKRRGHVLAILRLGNRQVTQHSAGRSPAPPQGNAVKDSGVVKIGVSLKWMIMKKARLPHVVCGLKTAQPRRESGDVTEDKRGGQRQ